MRKPTKDYFDWMYDLVCCDNEHRRRSYRKLLWHLHQIEFTYLILLDENRAKEGIYLRYHYSQEVPGASEYCTDMEECSVLEMLVALSFRCEELMDNPNDVGNQVSEWFWGMIDNLGLGRMDDLLYDERQVDDVIETFLNRDYAPNGDGGLFTLHDCPYDIRRVEIWYQLMYYLNEIVD